MKVQGRSKRGRPKRIWLDKVKDDIKEKGLSADDVYDRATWRCTQHKRGNNDEGEEEIDAKQCANAESKQPPMSHHEY